MKLNLGLIKRSAVSFFRIPKPPPPYRHELVFLPIMFTYRWLVEGGYNFGSQHARQCILSINEDNLATETDMFK